MEAVDKVFDKEKVDQGIHETCEVFDKLGLNILERWWVCHSIVTAASGLMGRKYEELKSEIVEIMPEVKEGEG